MMTEKKTQIFADGEQVIFLTEDNSASYAMTIKEPLLYSFQIDRPMGEDLYILGKNNPINIKQSFPIVDIKMNFKAKAEDLTQEISTDKNLLLNLNIFKKVSIKDMFKIINKKMKQRNKNNGGLIKNE